ncbi:hypothetical protein VE03_05794 [Pseudogymnoascus sp. 23342-1-I1]|nr:hypothetical protein VE03_05794 [Pseudogymnoascus sp. 23342-1-I1]
MSPQGTPVSRQIEVWLGDEDDEGAAYVMFDPEFSQAFQAERTLQGDGSTPDDPDLLPLEFHHDTQHFVYKSSSYPRLEIPQNLAAVLLDNHSSISPATLHMWGVAHATIRDGTTDWGVVHAITIDGTADSGFQHSVRETMQRLRPTLDKPKDM